MDIALIRELFTNCVRASELLGTDEDFRNSLRAKLARLPPYAVGSRGQLEEWPVDFAENEPTHRHVSHLYGVFPGDQITTRGTPALAAAARRTLDLRGDLATGWSLAWKINLWARLGDGDRARKCLALLLSPGRSYANLFDSCPPFQIDGNFGAAAGITEMLLQTDPGEIELLPALPGTWPTGSFTGLRAIGGYTVGCTWADGRLDTATIRASTASKCRVRYGDKVVEIAFRPGEEVRLDHALNH
jgi:alpha-L-fucosidase 2